MSRFTEVHAKHARHHRSDPYYWECECGEWGDGVVGAPDSAFQHAAHVESMLVEAGVVAVELPEADEDGDWPVSHGHIAFDDDADWRGWVHDTTTGRYYMPAAARAHAAALLAASLAAVRPVTPEEPR